MTRYGISKNRAHSRKIPGIRFMSWRMRVRPPQGRCPRGAESGGRCPGSESDAVQTDLLMDGKSIATVLNDGTKANKNIDVSLKKGRCQDPG